MVEKRIAPAALNALIEALVNIYWYKNDLRRFVFHCIDKSEILARLNWDDNKRNISSTLVELLSLNSDKYLNDLLRLMNETIKMKDFSHLANLDGGREKADKAKRAVKALEELFRPHADIVAEAEKTQEKRKEASERIAKVRNVSMMIEELKTKYLALVVSKEPQRRGYELESLIKQLFELHDLDPKASFRCQGEQIDGAFTFEGTDYLFEAKWQNKVVDIQELDAFKGKVERRLDNTLGLILSISGFSDDAVIAHSKGRSVLILMDGSDLMAILEERIELPKMLYRKKRYASETGGIYLRVKDLL